MKWLAAIVVSSLLSNGALAQVAYVSEPLTQAPATGRVVGGSFGPEGWTVTGGEDTMWFEVDEALPSGRVEVTVSNLSTDTNLTGALHDVMVIYGRTEREEPVTYAPFFRSNDFKVQIRIIGTGEPSRGPGASKLELRLCRAGAPGYHEICPADCPELVESAYLNGSPLAPLPWNVNRQYVLTVRWEPGSMTYDRGDAPVRLGFEGTYAPAGLRVRLGSPRHRNGTPDHLPIGMTFSNIRVFGTPGAEEPLCEDGAPVPAGPCIQATSLSPTTGEGAIADFRAVYSHCAGAETFRIVQLGVADEIAIGVPRVGANLEHGRFGIADMSCAPGEAMRISNGSYGGLDCARSSFTMDGDEMTVDWGFYFDPALFPGQHGVFFDAKGGAGTPEPRLGWRRMGHWTVPDEAVDAGETSDGGLPGPDGGAADEPDGGPDHNPVVDAGTNDGAGSSDGGQQGDEDAAADTSADVGAEPNPDVTVTGGCACRMGREGSPGAMLTLSWLALLFVQRRRSDPAGRPHSRRR